MQTTSVLRTSAEIRKLGEIRRFVQEAATGLGAAEQTVRKMLLAVDEAATNVVLHGYRGQGGALEVEVLREADDLVVRLRDQARAFDPTALPPPNLDAPLAERPVGGLGVYLVLQNMDRVSHRITESGGNELTLARRFAELPAKEDADANR